MNLSVVGQKSLSAAKSIAHHCAECKAIAGAGSFLGLGIGLNTIVPIIVVGACIYLASSTLYKLLKGEVGSQ